MENKLIGHRLGDIRQVKHLQCVLCKFATHASFSYFIRKHSQAFLSICTICKTGARHFVESHFVGTTSGRIRLLVDVTSRQVRHSVEKNSQVRHSVEMVNSIIL